MSSVLNSIVPIFAVIAMGSLLKRFGFIDEHFIRVSDRLIYFVFFPLLLFWEIGKPTKTVSFDWLLVAGVLFSVFSVFVLSLIFAKLVKMPDREVGSFSQGCYRFNSYIGIAIILTALGENGVKEFGVLIGFVIPFINILAVTSLIGYSEKNGSQEPQWSIILKSVVTNPLIISCVLGIAYSNLGLRFPIFAEKILSLFSMLSLPLPLICVGASLTFSKLKEHLTYSWAAAFFKLLVLPATGYFVLKQLNVTEIAFQVGLIYFALPTSPQNYILSSQLDSDVDLATSTIVLSTILSVFSLSAILLFFTNYH